MTVTDNFNRADESPLEGNWETLAANGVNLVSEQCQGSSGTCLSGYRTSAFAFLANQSSSVKVLTPGSSDNAGVGVRCANTGGGRGYIAQFNAGDGRIYVSKMTAGSLATLTAPEVTWFSGDILKLTATTSGANCDLEIFQNGVSVGTVTDSTSPYTTGQPALFYQLDNINATKLDDWQGEDASGGTVNTQTVTSNVSVSDSVIRSALFNRLAQELLTITDGPTLSSSLHIAILESRVEVTDELVRFLRLQRLLQDALTVVDEANASTIGGNVLLKIVTSQLLVMDEVRSSAVLTRRLEDFLAADDAGLTSVQRFITLTDLLTIDDSVVSSVAADQIAAPLIRIGFDQPVIDLGGYAVA